MKISTKGIYALEAMIDLAIHSNAEKPDNIKNIAARRKISEKYLEQIVGLLRNAGLIISIRGAGGGYRINRPLAEITVLQIMEAVEKNLVLVECLYKETDCGIDCNQCTARELWGGIWGTIKEVMENTTLEQLVSEVKRYDGTSDIEYYI